MLLAGLVNIVFNFFFFLLNGNDFEGLLTLKTSKREF